MEPLLCSVKKNRVLAPSVHHLDFDCRFDFSAGQFVLVDCGGTKRAFSLASSPVEGSLALCIRDVGACSHWLCSSSEKTEVSLQGPMGHFSLDGGDASTIVFICTGTGIAPFRSMIRTLFSHTLFGVGEDTEKDVILLYGAKTKGEVLYFDEFSALEEKENFAYSICLSQEKHPACLSGRVTAHLDSVVAPGTDYFLCGMSGMVFDVESLLLEKGVASHHIHKELYGVVKK